MWIAVTTPFTTPADADWVLWIVVAGAAVATVTPERWRSALLATMAFGTLAGPLWYRRDVMLHPSIQIEPEGADTDALYAWARDNTPLDAVFAVPPDLMRFRMVARRAIYVDFKSPPLEPDGLIEWHARLRRLTGADATARLPTHRANWQHATGDELLGRAAELGADFLVLDRSPEHDRIVPRPVFENAAFAVFALDRRK